MKDHTRGRPARRHHGDAGAVRRHRPADHQLHRRPLPVPKATARDKRLRTLSGPGAELVRRADTGTSPADAPCSLGGKRATRQAGRARLGRGAARPAKPTTRHRSETYVARRSPALVLAQLRRLAHSLYEARWTLRVMSVTAAAAGATWAVCLPLGDVPSAFGAASAVYAVQLTVRTSVLDGAKRTVLMCLSVLLAVVILRTVGLSAFAVIAACLRVPRRRPAPAARLERLAADPEHGHLHPRPRARPYHRRGRSTASWRR